MISDYGTQSQNTRVAALSWTLPESMLHEPGWPFFSFNLLDSHLIVTMCPNLTGKCVQAFFEKVIYLCCYISLLFARNNHRVQICADIFKQTLTLSVISSHLIINFSMCSHFLLPWDWFWLAYFLLPCHWGEVSFHTWKFSYGSTVWSLFLNFNLNNQTSLVASSFSFFYFGGVGVERVYMASWLSRVKWSMC